MIAALCDYNMQDYSYISTACDMKDLKRVNNFSFPTLVLRDSSKLQYLLETDCKFSSMIERPSYFVGTQLR